MTNKLTHPIIIVLLLLSIGTFAHAQDPRFSQFYASPYNLSPAMTGIFNGQWRTTLNYRDQWSSIMSPVPFRTYSVSAEYRRNIGRYDYWSVGFGALHDEAGTARFEQNKFHISGAYLKQLAGGRNRNAHYLSVGAQAGMGQNSLDWSRLWFSRQFDSVAEEPDFAAGNGENIGNGTSPLYMDFNAGILWYMVMNEGGFFYAGAAAHHLNQPDIALIDNQRESLYARWSAHAGGMIPVNDNFSFLPGAQWMLQGKSMEVDLGTSIRFSNNDLNELAMRFGAFTRIGNRLDRGVQADAVTVVTMFEYNRWMLGLSYDLTVSSLRTANNSRGAFEVSLSYIHPEHRKSRVVCPKF
jgi:type IX secretion system PorP/SprF family membrane protein